MKYVRHLNGTSWKHVFTEKLWPNQLHALRTIETYLGSSSAQQCLVRMPTGTGKTVVMAVIAQLAHKHNRVLVIAPWEPLADQLAREISSEFWCKSGLVGAFSPRLVERFTPQNADDARRRIAAEGILICTNSTLESLHREYSKEYSRLRDWCNLVLVDEGHREPAPQWANAVRDLSAQTILFTATPYRNDARLFEFDPAHIYSYTFTLAAKQNTIRQVEFAEAPWSRGTPQEYSDFATTVVAYRNRVAKELRVPREQLRVIVRCETRDAVEQVARALEKEQESVVGVHERFPENPEHGILRRSVPTPDQKVEAAFWVHQRKLLEGIDDSRFRILALFQGFKNSRDLVQQVGRIVRNPDHLPDEKAFVLTHPQDRQNVMWAGFLGYEEGVQERLNRGQPEAPATQLFREAREITPSFYVGGEFRRHLRASDVEDPTKVVKMRRSVLVFQRTRAIAFDDLIAGVEEGLISEDGLNYGAPWRKGSEYLRLYEAIGASAATRELYVEMRIAYVYLRLIGRRLYFTDSENNVPEIIGRCFEPVETKALARLLPDRKTTIGEITVLNGDLGNHVYRRRSLATSSLAIVPPGLSDYHHVCTTAVGRVTDNGTFSRRYIGFTRSRVVERETKPVAFSDFQDWIKRIDGMIVNEDLAGDESLERFATAVKYDSKAKVRHVLFDLEFDSIDLGNMAAKPAPADPANLWVISDNDGCFVGELDGRYFDATIAWDKARRLFSIDSVDLEPVTIQDPESGKPTSLVNFLTTTQRFRALVGEARDLIYTQRRFFRPNAAPWLGGRRRFDLITIVQAAPLLNTATTEKGKEKDPIWPTNSVFGALTKIDLKSGVFHAAGWKPDVLVCADIGQPEIADFIAISEKPRRIVQIHAKVAKDGSRMSASAFHDLCSQTVRYLAFFNPNDEKTKLSASVISGDWTLNGRSSRRLLLSGGMSAKQVARRIDNLVRDPSCAREVWMVMGQGLSRSDLENAIKPGASPKINERHMVYLLQSTWSAVASIGASLRVFCRT